MMNIQNGPAEDDAVRGPSRDDGADGLADEDEDDRESAASGTDPAVPLSASGIEHTYDSWLPFGHSVEVLRGADLEIRAGEVVGIVGENGSGKSTLLKTLVGVLDPDAGEIRRDGTVGWCPQEPLLYERLTVRETFRLFGEAYGLGAEGIAERTTELADRLDFARFLDRRIDRLSGGNRQKVNLSVALLRDPDVLLLDEPYTGFDWETYLAFWDLTDDLRERGTAIAVISHLVEERDRFDRVLELRDGRLHEETRDDADTREARTDVAEARTDVAEARTDAEEARTDAEGEQTDA